MKKVENSPLDPFVKWFFPKLLPLVPQWMTANKISAIGLLFSLFSGVSLALGFLSPWMYVLGAFFLFLTWITDTMDGVVARMRNQLSKVGHFLDHFGDSITVVLIGVGMYISNGSHLGIGLACAIVYLLFHIGGHIKVLIFDTMELTFIGPTEVRFIICGVMLGNAVFDYGRPLSWFPAITGNNGWLTKFLGFQTGLTFADVMGVLAVIIGFLALVGEVTNDLVRLNGMDKEDKQK